MLNKIFLETDGLVVGGTQLTTTGGNVNIANNVYVGGNTVTANLVVTGSFSYPKGTSSMPAFRAYGSAYVSALNGTITAAMYDKLEYDTSNCFNPTNQWLYVNGIYTPPWSWAPNVAGFYQVNAISASSANATAGAQYQTMLYRQNSLVGLGVSAYGGGAGVSSVVSTIVYMDGKSDYLSVYGWQNSGGTLTIGSSQPGFGFSGCLIRAA